mmetsp:Transcript_8936/g.26361  ORF Transcript_8936/g.26361 Transcript_8936/m.26361 type:complete len:310 (-) Transcript_8936:203-1132(-)
MQPRTGISCRIDVRVRAFRRADQERLQRGPRRRGDGLVPRSVEVPFFDLQRIDLAKHPLGGELERHDACRLLPHFVLSNSFLMSRRQSLSCSETCRNRVVDIASSLALGPLARAVRALLLGHADVAGLGEAAAPAAVHPRALLLLDGGRGGGGRLLGGGLLVVPLALLVVPGRAVWRAAARPRDGALDARHLLRAALGALDGVRLVRRGLLGGGLLRHRVLGLEFRPLLLDGVTRPARPQALGDGLPRLSSRLADERSQARLLVGRPARQPLRRGRGVFITEIVGEAPRARRLSGRRPRGSRRRVEGRQ